MSMLLELIEDHASVLVDLVLRDENPWGYVR
jgi:hypothetical protein